MTVGDLLHLARRHWVVSALMVALLGAVLLWGTRQHEAYNGRVAVLLLAPGDTSQNVLAQTTASLIATTGVVAGVVNGADPQPQTVGDVSLASAGVSQGWSVRQPNMGGQWDVHFEDPLLDVRSTGGSVEAAQQEIDTALTRIDDALATLQDAQGVPAEQRIRAVLNPSEPVFTKQSGSRIRTLGALGVVGLLAWGVALVAVERIRPRAERLAPPLAA